MRAVIVEDNENEAKKLAAYLERYGEEHGENIVIDAYPDAVVFLSRFSSDADIILMDIDMPDLGGMDAARKLRTFDPIVPLVFVTALSSFAVQGYSVGAFDFLVKPYSYKALTYTLDRVSSRSKCSDISVRNSGGTVRIPLDSIYYVEVNKHRVLYHTDSGTVDVWGSMKYVSEALPEDIFVRCGVSYLVNLSNVTGITDDFVIVGGDAVRISRAYKKKFLSALNAYIAAGGSKKK